MAPSNPIPLPLSSTPLDISPSRRSKRKDPIGKAVFYPTSARPTSRLPKGAAPPTPISPLPDLPPCSKYRRRTDLAPEPTSTHEEESERGYSVDSNFSHGVLGLDIPPPPVSSFSLAFETRLTSQSAAASFQAKYSLTPLLIDTSAAQQTYTFPERSPHDTYPPIDPYLLTGRRSTPALSPSSTPFRRDSSEQSLTFMMEGWNAFSPSTPARSHDVDDPPSAASIQVVSPDEMSMEHLIDEAYLDESPSRGKDGRGNAPRYLSQRALSPIINRATHLFDSPGHVSPPSTLSPLPPRQAAWGRRASAPMIFQHPTTSPRSPLAYLPPAFPTAGESSTAAPAFLFPQAPDAAQNDLFQPSYALQPSNFPPPQRDDYFGPLGDLPRTPPQVSAPPVDLKPPVGVAEQYLANRTLDPEFVKRYILGDELGSGGFGFVCAATQTGYDNAANVEVAVKFVFKSRMSDSTYGMPTEAYVLQQCDHPGIIKVFGIYEDLEFYYLILELHGDPWAPGHTLENEHPPATARSEIAYPLPLPPLSLHTDLSKILPTPETVHMALVDSPIAMDASPVSNLTFGGLPPTQTTASSNVAPVRPAMGRRASHDLFEAVENRRFTEEQARHIFKQIVDVVLYLHSKKIYHRDLKDENIVMDQNYTVKIIDFGSAVIEHTETPVAHDIFRGTMNYAPPEVLTGHAYQAGPADIWCLGILLAIILTGESCFPNQHWAASGQIRMKRPVSRMAFDLMMLCLTPDPTLRPTIDTIVEHPWFYGPIGGTGHMWGARSS